MTPKKLAAARAKWLRANGLTVRQVSDSIGIDYNTVVRWFEKGRDPRSLFRRAVVTVYADFPLAGPPRLSIVENKRASGGGL